MTFHRTRLRGNRTAMTHPRGTSPPGPCSATRALFLFFAFFELAPARRHPSPAGRRGADFRNLFIMAMPIVAVLLATTSARSCPAPD